MLWRQIQGQNSSQVKCGGSCKICALDELMHTKGSEIIECTQWMRYEDVHGVINWSEAIDLGAHWLAKLKPSTWRETFFQDPYRQNEESSKLVPRLLLDMSDCVRELYQGFLYNFQKQWAMTTWRCAEVPKNSWKVSECQCTCLSWQWAFFGPA